MKHEHPDKIIFLDIDGVINTVRSRYTTFDIEAMKNLEDVLDKTGAKIVVSSSWRREDIPSMIKDFKEHGCTDKICNEIIGTTVRGWSFVKPKSHLPLVRGNEIKEWVDRHLKYPWHSDPTCSEKYKLPDRDGEYMGMDYNKLGVDYSYVIFDDDTDMLYDQRHQFIRTNPMVGITTENSIMAIKKLNYK